MMAPSLHLLDAERWMRVLSAPRTGSTAPALFLDRDGVMIEECEYLADPDRVRVLPGCAALVRHVRSLGFAVVVVTNQSGIGRGYFCWPAYAMVEERLLALLAEQGAAVDAVLANAASPDGTGPGQPWRKPRPGMLVYAAATLGLDLSRSLIIGDKVSDIEAGRDAGLPLGIQLLTGHGREEPDARVLVARDGFAVLRRPDLASLIDDAKLNESLVRLAQP
jgi:D-glycero-D-manno-heptose 1,7-bisphosphate phosphatase